MMLSGCRDPLRFILGQGSENRLVSGSLEQTQKTARVRVGSNWCCLVWRVANMVGLLCRIEWDGKLTQKVRRFSELGPRPGECTTPKNPTSTQHLHAVLETHYRHGNYPNQRNFVFAGRSFRTRTTIRAEFG
jgi:hypothetical protein